MRIELLYILECPNSVEAARRLGAALAALGHRGTDVHMRLMESAADTVGTGFAGSPTITVDGEDIFPGGTTATDLACRIYRTPAGLRGLPTLEQIKEALTDLGL